MATIHGCPSSHRKQMLSRCWCRRNLFPSHPCSFRYPKGRLSRKPGTGGLRAQGACKQTTPREKPGCFGRAGRRPHPSTGALASPSRSPLGSRPCRWAGCPRDPFLSHPTQLSCPRPRLTCCTTPAVGFFIEHQLFSINHQRRRVS